MPAFRILGLLRSVLAKAIGLFRPIVREVSESDMRVVVHKSCALAAQTFMIAMANEGYDTCPLEGFDSKQMKKLLKLPHGARSEHGDRLWNTGWKQRNLG